jgi:hypothetical protein
LGTAVDAGIHDRAGDAPGALVLVGMSYLAFGCGPAHQLWLMVAADLELRRLIVRDAIGRVLYDASPTPSLLNPLLFELGHGMCANENPAPSLDLVPETSYGLAAEFVTASGERRRGEYFLHVPPAGRWSTSGCLALPGAQPLLTPVSLSDDAPWDVRPCAPGEHPPPTRSETVPVDARRPLAFFLAGLVTAALLRLRARGAIVPG